MRTNSRRSIGTAALLLIPTLVAWRAINTPMQLEPASRIWVKGSSTVRGFECQAGQIDATINAAPDAVTAVLAGDKAVEGVEVKIEAAKLDCRNGTMNGHMLKAIKATEHPTITFRLSTYDIAQADSVTSITMKGTLILGGVEKEIELTGTAKAGPEGALQVTGTYPLNMKEYGLKPPSLMLGTMKVNEKLTVGFDLLLKN
jgi:polyisoprenoid-binding protein YceI